MIDRRCLIMKACSFFTCLLYTVHVSAPYSTGGQYDRTGRFDTLWLFQSLSRRRPNDILAFDILFCSSASMWPSLAIILPRYVNSFTWVSVVSSTLMSSSMVIVEFGWNITSVFFMLLILRPNFDDALANVSTILWISSAEWAISALSSAKSSSLTSIFVVFVFALKCATVKRSAFCRDWM